MISVPLEYENRKGDKYHVFQGKTKTGKPKYCCSRKPKGDPVDVLPKEYEIYEHPATGLVTVRKAKPTCILPIEKEALERELRKVAADVPFLVDVCEDSLVVYAVDEMDRDWKKLAKLFGCSEAKAKEWRAKNAVYSPMLRFELCDVDDRLFSVQRWCYLGSIDDWIHLDQDTLADLAKKYGPHVGKDSFFELM